MYSHMIYFYKIFAQVKKPLEKKNGTYVLRILISLFRSKAILLSKYDGAFCIDVT